MSGEPIAESVASVPSAPYLDALMFCATCSGSLRY
jgi:hypothetical protein